MQRVLASGADLRIVFVTDGQNNPWPQRFLQRKWFLSGDDRAKWGATRRREALHSLTLFGIDQGATTFLGFPDSGISRMARSGDERLSQQLQAIVREWQPTLIVSPSMFDGHADHRAVSYFTHRAAPDAAIITYVVHGSGPAERLALRVALSEFEVQRKREAIEQHRSQLVLSRHRFLSYAREHEAFYQPEFDIVHVESRAHEMLSNLHFSVRVVLGLDPAPEDSGPATGTTTAAADRSR